MLRSRLFLTIGAAFLGMAGSAAAQEFRIHTTVTEVPAGRSKPRPVSRGLTIFHAGKVYDYLEESQEVMIQDPAHNRFLILSKPHDLVTEISQDEVRRFLGLAQQKAREMIGEWQRNGTVKPSTIAALEFQLLPEFQVRHDKKARTLTLQSPTLRYDVKYDKTPSQEVVQAYLRSVDWTAQLNSVLDPLALLPEPRLRLNEELRQLHVLPLEVELRIDGERPIHLRAKHEWMWELNPTDRAYIDHWESQLRRPEAQPIPFREFQQKTLVSEARKR